MIDRFEGENEFLSNFYPSPLVFQGKSWPTVEHAYQAMKSREPAMQEHIRNLPTARASKKAGRAVVCRNDWEQIKWKVMLELVRAKFMQNADLAVLLLATGDRELVEGNWWHDNTWGNCTCERCGSTLGQNWLGRFLMQVRADLAEMGLVCQS